MAGKGRAERRRGAAKRPARKRRLGAFVPVAGLLIVAFLYYRPIATYVETRGQLTGRRAEVVQLRAEKVRVERRLERASSLDALAREARRIGYVKPGEQLFIVKGIDGWRRGR